MRRLTSPLLALALAAAVGCGNPADDKPEAQVGEASGSRGGQTGGTAFVLTDATKIGFVGSKVTGSHEGGFNTFEGTVNVVDGDPTRSSVSLTIDTTSLWSDTDRLTEHLKSDDFFDVETYPTATFTSTRIAAAGEGYEVTGDLMLHGTTKSITFPATIELTADAARAQAEFVIKRFDFGIEFAGMADDLIRDEVVMSLDVAAAPAGAAGEAAAPAGAAGEAAAPAGAAGEAAASEDSGW